MHTYVLRPPSQVLSTNHPSGDFLQNSYISECVKLKNSPKKSQELQVDLVKKTDVVYPFESRLLSPFPLVTSSGSSGLRIPHQKK